MGRVIHFEFSSKEPEKAAEFYREVFGWKFDKWEGPLDYWLVTTGDEREPGINGGLGTRGEEPPATVNTIDVKDAKKAMEMIEKAGGKILSPIHAVPGVGWNAYFTDPEGNQWGIMQDDPNAK
jgi:predicted enzyme related to lactoylglutathione lyase